MKIIKIILGVTVLACLFACERKKAIPLATFTKPQPANTESLSKFPKRLQGRYLSLEDSSVITINDKLIQRIYDLENKLLIHPNQLDSTAQIRGDTLVFVDIDEKIMKMKIIKHVGDSLLIRHHRIDTLTLFKIGRGDILKKFKGFFFLNTRYDDTSWAVEKVQLAKGVLVVSSILTEADIKKLEEITETETITAQQDTLATVYPQKFTTTKKQFKTFVKNEGFSSSETFIKQK